MTKYFLVFIAFFGATTAAPLIQEDVVDCLKPRLNSDRIEYFFGNYGVEALNIESLAFPTSRIANLHSIHDGKKIMRTLAVVDFIEPIHQDLINVHNDIIEGKSIGIALRQEGWIIQKVPVYFGMASLSPEVMNWMDESCIDKAALHVYRLEVFKEEDSKSIPYCTILEVHSPQYLSPEWLHALYSEQYEDFSRLSKEISELLFRLSRLIGDFPDCNE